MFNGPDPVVRVLDTVEEECAVVGRWLAERAADGVTARNGDLRPFATRTATGAGGGGVGAATFRAARRQREDGPRPRLRRDHAPG